MDTSVLLVLVVIVLLAVIGWLVYERQKSQRLRTRFGPEYERTVNATGSRKAAEAELDARQRRVAALRIRPLPADDRDRYAADWRRLQARFVDEPWSAMTEADELISEVMERRGYPVDDFEQRAADVSVDHPAVVEHYRAAHAIAAGPAGTTADTEQLRQALVHYRALFDDLLAGPDGAAPAADGADAPPDLVPQPELTRRAS